MSTENSVLVFGSTSLDIVGKLENELHPRTSNPAHIRTSQGGVARNIAENLARLGQSVSLVTVVGKDQAGDDILAYTEEAGVDITNCLRSEEFPTGFYLAALDNHGGLAFGLDDMRIMNCLDSEFIKGKSNLFKSSSWVFLDGNLSENSIKTIFRLAKKSRIPVCADPTSTSLVNRLIPHLDKIDLIIPNSAEAAILTGLQFKPSDQQKASDAARILVNKGVGIAVISLAEFGVCYATSETTGYVPAIGTTIIDPTGAGAALTAAILFGILNEIPLDDSIRLGVSAASLTLKYQGTVDPQISLERLYDLSLI